MSNLTTVQKQTAPAQRPSALQFMASRLNVDAAKLTATLKATVFKGASDEEMLALVVVANSYDLDPLLKEIYAFPAKGGGIAPIISVDGWNKMLIRQPTYNGKRFEFKLDENGGLVSCTCFVHIKGRDFPEEITEYLHECYRKTDNWDKMPYRMLRNRALCQAARMSFGFSGVYSEDEAQDFIDVTAEPSRPTELPPKMVALPVEAKTTPQDEFAAFIEFTGHTFDQARNWAKTSQGVDLDHTTSFAEFPAEMCARWVLASKTAKGKAQLIAELKALTA